MPTLLAPASRLDGALAPCPLWCSEDGQHAVSYELGWRRLSDPTRTASRAVLSQLGDKLLSSVKYVNRRDTFDNPAFPMQGEKGFCAGPLRSYCG